MTSVQGYPVLALFALGTPALVTTQEETDIESRENNNIIEGIFLDSSETPKSISMKQWAVAFCPNALFIFKADEKMFIIIYQAWWTIYSV